jgi:hypothetical protein
LTHLNEKQCLKIYDKEAFDENAKIYIYEGDSKLYEDDIIKIVILIAQEDIVKNKIDL